MGSSALYNTNITSISIPKSLCNKDQTSSALTASKLREVTFEEGVEHIPSSMFKDCDKLENMIIPETVNTIGSNAFQNCSGLTEITVPSSVTSIWQYAFDGCSNLTKVTLNEGLQTINNRAFSSCAALTEIELPSTLETIGEGAFYDCISLESINIPKDLKRTNEAYYYASSAPFGGSGIKSISFGEGLTKIDAGMFAHCLKLESIEIPDSVTEIGAYAFYNCSGLKMIRLPESMEILGYDVFRGCSDLTIFCKKYSKATINIIDQGIKYVSYNDKRTLSSNIINDRGSVYEPKSSSGKSFVCTYDVDANKFKSLSNTYIKIRIPSGAVITTGTLYHNDELCTDYNDYTDYITIPVKENSGRISFSLSLPEDNPQLVTYATYNFTNTDGTADYEIIDIINNDVPLIAVYAESITSSDNLDIYGIAPASSTIDISVDGSLVTSAESNKAGSFNTSITLPNASDGKKYTIEVSTESGGALIKDETTVIYKKDAPELQSFTMKYKGQTYDLMSNTKYSISIVPNIDYTFHFEVKYSNPEAIGAVYISSTKNQAEKTVEAMWDENTETFIYDGFFDNDNPSYLPGRISARYALKSSNYTASTIEDYSDIIEDAIVTENIKTEEELNYDIDFGSGNVWNYDQQNDVSIEDLRAEFFPEEAKRGNSRSLSSRGSDSVTKEVFEKLVTDLLLKYGEKVATNVTKDNIETGILEAYVSDEDRSSIYHVWYEPAEKVIKKQAIKYTVGDTFYILGSVAKDSGTKIGLSKSFTKSIYLPYKSAVKTAGVAISTGKTIIDYGGQMYDVNKIDNQIRTSNYLSGSQKSSYLKDLNNARSAYTMIAGFEIATACTGAILTATLGPVGGMLFGIVTGIISGLIKDEADKLVEMIDSGTGSQVQFLMDPSGYVYEAVTANRLSGVKVTTYWIPYNEEDADFWERPDETNATVWNADEYSQMNPLYTDMNGDYSWDVPEGWWKVVAQKDGYEDYTTGWMPVPPPQMNVNIGMTVKEAPAVTFAAVYSDRVLVTFDQYMKPDSFTDVQIRDPNGNNVPYRLIYNTNETDASGAVLAKSYSFLFEDSYSVDKTGEYTIYIGTSVSSYNGKNYSGDAIRRTYNKEKEIELPESVTVPYNGYKWLQIECKDFDGDESVNGRSVDCDTAEIVAVSNISDDKFELAIRGKMIGQTQISVNVPSAGISETITVKVPFLNIGEKAVEAPTGFSSTNDSGQGITLSWDADERFAYYEIYKQSEDNQLYYQIGSSESSSFSVTESWEGCYLLTGVTQSGERSELTDPLAVGGSAHVHTWSDKYTVDVEASCTDEGSESVHCSICGASKEGTSRKIDKKPHAYGEWTVTRPATETAPGQQTRKCSVCGASETRTVAQLAPTLPAVKITKPAAAKKSATVKWKKVAKKNLKKVKKIEIQYSLDKSFSTGVKTKYASAKKTSLKIKGLKSKKTYYVRIRAYTNSGGVIHVSKWSGTKKAKVR